MNSNKVMYLEHLRKTAQRAKAEAAAIEAKLGDIQIPTKVSELTNDSGYQTAAQVAAAVAGSDHLKRRKVESLEAIDLTAPDAAQYIYMVPKANAKGGDKYDEYMVLDGALEPVGSWAVDLTGYVQAEEGKGLSANDFTDEDKAKLDGMTFATDAEVDAMLAEVFGAGTENT